MCVPKQNHLGCPATYVPDVIVHLYSLIHKTNGSPIDLYHHGIRRMVEARSGLPKKSLTLTMKKRVLECKFGVTYF